MNSSNKEAGMRNGDLLVASVSRFQVASVDRERKTAVLVAQNGASRLVMQLPPVAVMFPKLRAGGVVELTPPQDYHLGYEVRYFEGDEKRDFFILDPKRLAASPLEAVSDSSVGA